MKHKREAKADDGLRRLFISLMSHEIRTPLTTIYGYVQLLNKTDSNFTDHQKRWMHSLFYETARMSNMIEEMLQLYQLEDESFEIFKNNADILDILHNSLARFKSLYPNYNVAFENAIKMAESNFRGDSVKLTQVLTNVLINAARFSPESRDVSLVSSLRANDFLITVVDWGDGMPKDKLTGLLAILNKGKEVIRSGNGLSLYVANAIIKAHGGKFTIRSRPNLGTTIEIILPANL